jgi:hypothetical protein
MMVMHAPDNIADIFAYCTPAENHPVFLVVVPISALVEFAFLKNRTEFYADFIQAHNQIDQKMFYEQDYELFGFPATPDGITAMHMVSFLTEAQKFVHKNEDKTYLKIDDHFQEETGLDKRSPFYNTPKETIIDYIDYFIDDIVMRTDNKSQQPQP